MSNSSNLANGASGRGVFTEPQGLAAFKGSRLAVDFAGIKSPNPFWLASAPPSNCGEQVMRAFDAGWGGAVWKTIGAPVQNVSSRYSSIDWNGQRMMGLNNIELISDRPIEVNLREITEVKKRYPKHAVIASLMVESNREAWHTVVAQAEDAGADGLELNFGCPHGMSERGMGSAVGQVPEYAEMITAWVKERARTPVIVKLTPNISDIRVVARAAKRGGADALSAINTINSITGIDLDTFTPRPYVAGKSSHGGYCGPAVKPIALNMIQQVMSDVDAALPMSGIGGIANWKDAAEFILLGSGTVQVCTAAMHYGYRIVEDMIDGLQHWMEEKGFASINDFRGLSIAKVTEWKHLDLNYKTVAHIDEAKCIGCDLCYTACWDGAHQCIHVDRVSGVVDGPVEMHRTPASVEASSRSRIAETPVNRADIVSAFRGPDHGPYATPLARIPRVDETECVGCNLCSLVCPVEECITMVEVDTGRVPETWDERSRLAGQGATC
jgi:dihydropyrimidine dehydrogenase (NAD+) subunit PreA